MADEVEVTVTESDKDETESAPVVVSTPVIVNESDSDSGNDSSAAALVEIAATLGNIVARLDALENRETAQDDAIESAAVEAEIATNIATDALMSDDSGEDEETDNPPVKPHWVHRPLGSLFGDSE